MEIDYWRQMDILNPEKDLLYDVTIIGAGGIGSPTTLALAKMGFKSITVYDPDDVEEHNIPNQLYPKDSIGNSKAISLKAHVSSMSDAEVEPIIELVESTTYLNGIIVSGVDTMSARHDIWNAVRYKPNIPLYIDARMGAEVARVYAVNPAMPGQVEKYETTLYSDMEAEELPCTAQAIIYNVFMIASLVASQVKKYVRGEKYPFEIVFDLATLTLVTDNV